MAESNDSTDDAKPNLSPEAVARRCSEKRAAMLSALDNGRTQVRIDPRRAGARLPAHLEDEHAVALNLSWRFPQTNMVVNERGLAATLRFNGASFRVVLPWTAIWAVLPPDADALVWPPDLPEELGGPSHADEAEPGPVEPMRPRLSVIGEDSIEASPPPAPKPETAPEPPATPAEPPPPPSDKPRPSFLKLVR